MRKMVLLAAMMALAALMLAAAPASAQEFDRNDFCDFFFDDDFFNCVDRDFFDDDFNDVEQEAESGDVDQSFDVSGPGDNSNQTVGIQGVANTGNAQNVVDFNDGFNDGFFFCDEDRDRLCDDDDFFFDDRFFFDDDFFDEDDDFEFEDVGSSIEVSPTQVVNSDQQVNQAAAAAR